MKVSIYASLASRRRTTATKWEGFLFAKSYRTT